MHGCTDSCPLTTPGTSVWFSLCSCWTLPGKQEVWGKDTGLRCGRVQETEATEERANRAKEGEQVTKRGHRGHTLANPQSQGWRGILLFFQEAHLLLLGAESGFFHYNATRPGRRVFMCVLLKEIHLISTSLPQIVKKCTLLTLSDGIEVKSVFLIPLTPWEKGHGTPGVTEQLLVSLPMCEAFVWRI